jgi:hypothetical protein
LGLEHYRKDAKQLLRAFRAGLPEARRRAYDALGKHAHERFQLSDAQHVVATEYGYRSWPQLKHAAERPEPERPAEPARAARQGEDPEPSARSDVVIDTDLAYRPGEPVRLRVRRREQRLTVSDEGIALVQAGPAAEWRAVAQRLERELDVNVSRAGAVWLPVVAAGPPRHVVERRIAEASLTFYQELLELAGA